VTVGEVPVGSRVGRERREHAGHRRKSGDACGRRGCWTPRAAGAASGMCAPGPGSAELTSDSCAARHRAGARRAVSTQRPRFAGL